MYGGGSLRGFVCVSMWYCCALDEALSVGWDAVSVVEVLRGRSRHCAGGRGAVSVAELLRVGRGVARAVEALLGRSRCCAWSRRCAVVDVLRGVSDASREATVLLRLLGVVCLCFFCLSAIEDLSEFIREVFCILNILIVEEKEF